MLVSRERLQDLLQEEEDQNENKNTENLHDPVSRLPTPNPLLTSPTRKKMRVHRNQKQAKAYMKKITEFQTQL